MRKKITKKFPVKNLNAGSPILPFVVAAEGLCVAAEKLCVAETVKLKNASRIVFPFFF